MKKTLTAIALLTVLGLDSANAQMGVGAGVNVGGVGVGAGVGVGVPGARMAAARAYMGGAAGSYRGGSFPLHAAHNEGLQNYYYYFGAPCCDRPAPCGVAAAPCAAPCADPCNPCAPCNVNVEYEQVCRTCDPCGNGVFGIFPWNW